MISKSRPPRQIFTFPVIFQIFVSSSVLRGWEKIQFNLDKNYRGIGGIWVFWRDGILGRAWITLLCVFQQRDLGTDEGDIRLQCLLIHEQYSSPRSIRKDFSFFLKLIVSNSFRIVIGRRFQSFGPAWENALHPYLLLKLVSRR